MASVRPDYKGGYEDPLDDVEYRERKLIELLEAILTQLGGTP